MGTITLTLLLGSSFFTQDFHILPITNQMILGGDFFANNGVALDLGKQLANLMTTDNLVTVILHRELLHMPELSVCDLKPQHISYK